MSAPEIINPGAASGGTPVGGSGTPGTLAKFTGAGTSIGDSAISESGILISINAGVGTNMVINDGTGMAGPSYDGVRLCRGSEALFSSSDSVRTFRAGVTGATVVAGSTTSHDLLLQRGNVTALTLGASGAVAFAGNLTSSAAQTWTLATGTSALNIASNLLNLDTTNSRVGIGTASPDFKLEVNGTIGLTDASGPDYSSTISAASATPFRILTIASRGGAGTWRGVINLDTNYNGGSLFTALTVRANTDGTTANVGIGTASPTSALDVVGTITSSGPIRATGTSATAPAFTGSDTDTGVYFPAANQVRISTAGSLAIAVDASQNVGVGTASPTGRLHVVGGTAAAATNGAPVTIIAQNAGTGNQNGGNIVLTPGALSGTGSAGVADLSGPTGTGLKLPATPGNADSQTLDCYLDGGTAGGAAYTPVVTNFGGTITTITGRYVRTGCVVFARVDIIGTSLTTTAFLSTVTAPPFSASGNFAVCIRASSGTQASAYHISGGSSVEFSTAIAASGQITLTWFYFV